MKYQYLDKDQQKAMLESRLRQLEQEHYGHSMILKNADPADEPAIKAAEEALKTIDRAYGAVQTELSALTPAASTKEK